MGVAGPGAVRGLMLPPLLYEKGLKMTAQARVSMERLLGWRMEERVSGMAAGVGTTSVELFWPMDLELLQLRVNSRRKGRRSTIIYTDRGPELSLAPSFVVGC